jgi:hypothetical protein
MTSSPAPSISAKPRREKLGLYSCVVAAVAIALFMAAFAIFYFLQRTNWFAAQSNSFWFFLAVAFLVVPIMEFVGVVMGTVALFQSGDRKLLGLIGAVLNALLLIGGIPTAMALIANSGR